MRIGFGWDLHRLVLGRKLVIGGVEIKSDYGSLAHSDGDVLIHALIDSLISPLGIGDIGQLFPDTDEKYRNVSGLELLKKVKENYLKNTNIINLDSTIILDDPKIAPYIDNMKQNLSLILGISKDKIGIKGKTSENTRLFSIECYAVTLLD